jgi:hypothetical protein
MRRPSTVQYSKHELRIRAAEFARKHAEDRSEASERQIFWNDLFGVFGREVKEVGRFEVAAKRLSTGNTGSMDLLVPGEMGVEHKSLGEDLGKAMSQLFDYLDDLQPTAEPWLLVVCDFQNFYYHDLKNRTQGKFTLEALPEHIEIFWWLAGYVEKTVFEDEEEANLVATGYMADLHDAVLSSGYDPHSLREWLTRILFCLFADDTEVWEHKAFANHILLNTRPDGSDLGPTLAYLFQLLNTPPDKRAKNLDEDLSEFTYINGDLFSTVLPIPNCDAAVRTALLKACKFDWSAISPAIFGSMFQNVMTPAERRQLGAHYTTEANIMKTIRPLFLDDLEKELATIRVANSRQSRAALRAFHDKLASLTFMDPALGCGNFLVIAYREIRRLETEVLRKEFGANANEGVVVYDVSHFLQVTVDQFYGIEIEEFPARIARTALYLMDHKANREFSAEFGEYYARFPIPSAPHIRIHNALDFDWNNLLPADQIDFIFGNPPFVGMSLMDADQQEDNRRVFSHSDTKALRTGRLDYVACWYEQSMIYATNPKTRIAFVSTNSITQGEQARTLGPLFELRGFTIDFAHTTFAWSSEAHGTANVHCVIIGLSHSPGIQQKRLFEYLRYDAEPVEVPSRNINIYLADGPNLTLAKRTHPFINVPRMTKGCQPTDDGGLIVEPDQYEVVMSDPLAAKYVRPLVGARDLLNHTPRWCLWLVNANPSDLRNSRVLQERLAHVAHFRRMISPTASVQAQAATPGLFTQIRQPKSRWLGIPAHSSENRRIVPMTMLGPEYIAHNSVMTLDDPPIWLFGILQSSMFDSWLRAVGGRLESRLRIEPDLVYNTFPFPELDDANQFRIEGAMQGVLDARANYPYATLADLYDALSMPSDLTAAHDQLDQVVLTLYTGNARSRAEPDRLGLLFERYAALSAIESAS